MKKRIKWFCIVFTLMLFISLNSAFLTSVPTQDYEEVEISFSEPSFSKTGEYDLVRVLGASFMTGVGKPMLPVKGIQVLVEDKKIDRVEIISSDLETLEGDYFIQPVQYPISSELNFTLPEVEPDESVYGFDDIYPNEVFEMSGVSRMRDYPLLNLLVYPLQYKPHSRELIFYRSLELRIYYKSDVTIKTSSQVAKEKRHESELFDNFVRSSVVNPDKIEEIKSERDSQYSISGYSVQASPTYCPGLPTNWVDELKYLAIVGHGNVVEDPEESFTQLPPLIEWKKKKGIPAKLANYSDITGDVFNCEGQDNAEKVRNFIKDVYDLWGIEYVLMGGSDSVVSSRQGYGYVSTEGETNIYTDLYYADLDDNSNWSVDEDSWWGEANGDTVDLTPDVFIGRILSPSQGADEYENLVYKVLRYEGVAWILVVEPVEVCLSSFVV